MNCTERKHPRLQHYDYSAGGTFCITICTGDRKMTLGTVVAVEEPKVALSPLGALVEQHILRIPEVYAGAKVLNYVVMPNHIHILLQIASQQPVSLFTVVRSTKSAVTKTWGSPVWQRSYYEHVVRSEKEALRFWKYIDENPAKWLLDRYYQKSAIEADF